MAENKVGNGTPQSDSYPEDKKKRNRIALALILIIALVLGGIWFFFMRGNDGDDAVNSTDGGEATSSAESDPSMTSVPPSDYRESGSPSASEEPSSESRTRDRESSAPSKSNTPSTSRERESQSDTLSPWHKQGVDTSTMDPEKLKEWNNRKPMSERTITSATPTVPTTQRGTEEDYNNHHAAPWDPRFATPDTVADMSIVTMFNVTPGDKGWEEGFDRAKNFMTDDLKKRGFKKWWLGDEHSSTWKIASAGKARVRAIPTETIKEEWLSGDTVAYTIKSDQRLYDQAGRSNARPFETKVTMKYTDGKWLMDDYSFGANKAPAIY